MSRARDNADLGDSYGVLGSGVTGGSGLTALASNPTVTLGSNATFPAGFVLQVIHGTPNVTTYTSSSLGETTCTNFTNTIDKSISGSKIVAFYSASYQVYQNNSNAACELFLDFDRTSPSSATFGLKFVYLGKEDAESPKYHNLYSSVSGTFEDTSTATGNHIYVAHVRAGNSGDASPVGAITGVNSTQSTIVLMEVAT